ncbi:MAG: hypothetical protein R3Y24_06325 [Eubacteriales bacterium]
MLFNSYIFILCFLPVTVLGYFALNAKNLTKVAMGFLILMSFIFYGYNNISYVGLLAMSIIVNHIIVFYMEAAGKVNRKLLMWLAICFNIGLLLYFKYFDFFISNCNELLKTEFILLNIMLPLGISFYTFQQISYVIRINASIST